jgi:hypothetical protein
MSKIAHVIIDQTSRYFSVALVAFGLIATILWASTIVVFALARIWSIVPGGVASTG